MARQTEQPEPQPEDTPSGKGGRFGWIGRNRFAALLGFLSLVALAGGLIVWRIVATAPGPPVPPDYLAIALTALDVGDFERARTEIEKLGALEIESDHAGEYAFVRALLALDEASALTDKERRAKIEVAAHWFDDARVRGLPPGRLADALLLLARCRIDLGEADAARLVLDEARESVAGRAVEIHLLRASSYLEDPEPKPAAALAENLLALGTAGIDADLQRRALLQRCETLLRLERPGECLETLAQLHDPNEPDAAVLRAQAELMQILAARRGTPGDPKTEQLKSLCQKLQQLQDTGLVGDAAVRKASFLLGRALEPIDPAAAIAQFESLESVYPDTLEAQAADFYRGELLAQAGRRDEAAAAWRRAMRACRPNAVNPWLPDEMFRRRMLEVHHERLEARDYPACLEYAAAFTFLFSKAQGLETTAETHRNYGRDLLAQAAEAVGSKSEQLARQGRSEMRLAGAAYAELAKLRYTERQYPDDVWNAAAAYLDGHAYPQAAAMFEEFLNHEVRRRQSDAMVGLAESQLALDRLDEAIETLRRCTVLYPRDLPTFRARLLAASAYVEKGDLAAAERSLTENLDNPALTPDSKEWRDTLFAYGRLLHRAGRYEDALARLDEAAARYPDNPQALEARYLAADCCRRLAGAETLRLARDYTDDAKQQRQKRIAALREDALGRYRQAIAALQKRHEEGRADELEKTMLRNSHFAAASLLADLGRWDEAVRACNLVAARYHNVPEVLDAYVQLARVYQQMDKRSDARGTIELARAALGQMKNHPGFRETTNYTARQWDERLASLAAALADKK